MPRYSYLTTYERLSPPPTAVATSYRTTYSCIPRVADFFGVKPDQYIPSPDDKIDRAGYQRSYNKVDGTKGTVTVPAGKIVYANYGKANAKTVRVKTGADTAGKRQILTFTFPSFLNIAEIGDALSELIPPAKIAITGVATPVQIEPFFTIVGGRTYPLSASTVAAATPSPDLAKTEAEQVTALATSKSRKKKKTL